MNDEIDENEIRNLITKFFDDDEDDDYQDIDELKRQLELSRKNNELLQQNYRTMVKYCQDQLGIEQLQIRSSREDLTKLEPLKISTNDRLDELMKENATLKRKIDELENQTRRSGSSSSSGSGETVIATNTYIEQIRKLTKELEETKREYADLEEKYEYEKHELQAMIEQLREDMVTAEANRVFANNHSNSVEEALRTQFEFDLKRKLDDVHRILDEDYRGKIKVLQDELTRVQNEKQNEEKLQTRLILVERELENLKEDYTNLNEKKKDLFNNCSRLENENEGLQRSIKQVQEKLRSINDEHSQREEQLLREIRQLNQLNDLQKEELRAIQRDTVNQQKTASLEEKLQEYEQAFEQYEYFRKKLEENLDKIVQQRNRYKLAWKTLKKEKISAADKIRKIEEDYRQRYERMDDEQTRENYRNEIDRLNHENAQLVEHQSKLISEHEKQMEKMSIELDRGYTNVIDEFREEQNHFQKRIDLLKEQLNEAQRTIEMLKHQFDLLKQNNTNDQQFRDIHERLLQERTIFLRKESEYQKKISGLQVKIAEMLKKPFEERIHHLRDLNTARPRSFPEIVRFSPSPPPSSRSRPVHLDYSSNFEKRRSTVKKISNSKSKENANGFSRQFIDDADFY